MAEMLLGKPLFKGNDRILTCHRLRLLWRPAVFVSAVSGPVQLLGRGISRGFRFTVLSLA